MNGRVGFNAVVDAVGDVRFVEYFCNVRDNTGLDEAPVGDDLCLFRLLFVQNLGNVANSPPPHDEARGTVIAKVILKRHEQTPLRFLFQRQWFGKKMVFDGIVNEIKQHTNGAALA